MSFPNSKSTFLFLGDSILFHADRILCWRAKEYWPRRGKSKIGLENFLLHVGISTTRTQADERLRTLVSFSSDPRLRSVGATGRGI